MAHSVEYLVQRNVPASTRPDTPANVRIAMVQVKLPDGGITQVAIREDELRFECGGDARKETAFIEQRIRETLLAEFPNVLLHSAIQTNACASLTGAMLITILVVIIVLALALYAIQLIPADGRLLLLLQIVAIVIAMVVILRAAGLG
jgi:hypothetical protein